MVKYPSYISKLISLLRKLPGVGFKTAEKLAFELLEWNEEQLQGIGQAFMEIASSRCHCPTCFCLKNLPESPCDFCQESRDPTILCILATPKDVFSFERSRVFRGHYFILGTLLSPITGKHIQDERLQLLKQRIQTLKPKEIIIALDATLEGDATALFLKQELISVDISISRLALGLPIGLSFDYIDPNTLARAFSGRSPY
ncbi:recombination mediator RecR [Chlamydia gallinacea]|uniref:Recombination protein RecR n=2 Tax=Chlamydia gallinacea TaxID=1457153 RepID=A0A173E023_9CHLA|nr:recombination mediator RecR [Chlamydia gallinacea]EYE60343.1 recombination protein RecR [Bacteroides fragilis str. S6L5]ANG66506.1 recombination protein RecR [Chlamydia gallinacea 08-1274/3]AQT77307.1 recombination protein RecR [Chlamydia gallinacea]MBX6680252.1 recombination protein RecR [Chlamydia gallinacea]MBX6687863.1 recombination protein RecR [Chlamydia gallinacea]